MKEEWKEYLPGYWVSNMGRVWSEKTKRFLKLGTNKEGYKFCVVTLGKRKLCKVIKPHIAVAKLFIQNKNNYPMVNHIDGVKTNNIVTNLEWCTAKQNAEHANKFGLIKRNRGEENHSSKLKKEDVIYIKEKYIPRDKIFGERALAKKFCVSHVTIGRIVNGKLWGHIK